MEDSPKQKLENASNSVLELAGLSGTPSPGYVSAGVSKTGGNVFISSALAKSTNLQTGALLTHSLAAFVDPFHVLTKKEKDGIDYIGRASGNPKLISELDNLHANRQGPHFGATLIRAARANAYKNFASLTAIKLYDHWGIMSPAQKSLAIAAFGIQGHKTDSEGTVCDLKIIDGLGQVFTVRDALKLFQSNKNPYPLVEYWTQIYKLHQVFGGEATPEAMADFAMSHGLLAKGSTTGAAVPGVTKQKIDQVGAKPAPQYGVGALAVPQKPNDPPPPGYGKVADVQGGSVIAPQANARSAEGAVSGSLLGTSAGAQGSSTDAAALYSRWDKKDKTAQDKGSLGGVAFLSGLTGLKQMNPFLYGALVSFLLHYSHETMPTANPLQYFALLSGTALARIVAGKKSKEADLEAAQISKKIHDQSEGSAAKLQVDTKALYASFGISSRADAYQLSNQAYSENRINESDLTAVHEVLDILYGQNFMPEVQKLMTGKDRGLEVVKEGEPPIINKMTDGQKVDNKAVMEAMTKEELRKKNAARYRAQAEQQAAQAAAMQSQGGAPQEEGAGAPPPDQGAPPSEQSGAPAQPEQQTSQMGATA